ncbi:small subunit processome component 20 homolog [Tubulanus polymorphus]|uniref:small subunit processome component 20 homolog n=1 Tax=Tubulanus polymorphus TaxID=672921 RepID=UPI003DA2B08A
MRNKSSNHKEQNTFKFQTFTDRIASINVDVIRRIGKRTETPEDADTFFSENLQKWIDLNCTQHFTTFRKEISSQVQSLPQLLFHEATIAEALKRHLQVPESLALEPLLDLTVHLARDLQQDFYPKFASFFQIIIGLLEKHHKNAEVLEQLFTTLSYLFKFQWRYMTSDIKTIFSLYLPLLDGDKKHYIRRFAAESFGFLVRKCRDQDEFFLYILKCIEENKSLVDGIGRVIFEVVKGVKEKLHSNAETVLKLLLSRLKPSTEYSPDLAYELLEVTLQCILEHTTKDNLAIVWKVVQNCVESQHEVHEKARGNKRIEQGQYKHRLLQVLLLLVSHKDGVVIYDVESLCILLVKLLQGDHQDYEVTDVLFNVVSSLLMSPHCKLSITDIPKLISLVFKAKCSRHLQIAFTGRMFSMNMFEKDMLPPLLNFCHTIISAKDEEAHIDVLALVTELLLLKAPLHVDSSTLDTFHSYMLDFSVVQKGIVRRARTFPSYILSVIDECNLDQPLNIWAALVCLPHIRPIDDKQYNEAVSTAIDKLLTSLETTPESTEDVKEALLFQAIHCQMCKQCPGEFYSSIEFLRLLDWLKRNPTSEHALRSFDIYLYYTVTNGHEENISNETFQDVYSILKWNLASSSHQVRLMSLRILSQFPLRYPTLEDQGAEQLGVFRICLEAELVPLTVHHYRTKLMYLQKLECNIVYINLPVIEGNYMEAPLLFLLGNLYINFTLIWQPISNLIASYSEGMDRAPFWKLFAQQLKKATDIAEAMVGVGGSAVSSTQSSKCINSTQAPDTLRQIYTSQYHSELTAPYRPDHCNYRQLLWQTMHLFSDVCEAKSRDLVPLLVRFLQNEFYSADHNSAPTQDLTRKVASDMESSEKKTDECMETEKDVSFAMEDQEETEEEKEDVKTKRSRKMVIKLMIAKLRLLAKFHSPLSVYLEPKLKELYFELLAHRNCELQKVAFDCIMTYKYKYLMPYKENFMRLFDDRRFKTEIVMFSIDSESNVILEEHREELLPVLMRILYGKMHSKTGKDTSGKSNSTYRKSIVFRFLAGCRQKELKVFIDLIFGPFQKFTVGDVSTVISELVDNLDLEKMIPIRRQQSILSTMDVVFKKLGNLIDVYLPDMLRIVLCLTAITQAVLDRRVQVNPKAITMLKTLRMLGLTRIIQFFASFETYNFTKEEIDAIFQAAIWPQLKRLPVEGVYHPTALLKLLNVWSRDPRFLPLLGKCLDDDRSVYPVPFIVKLLVMKNVSKTVVQVVMEIVESLLTTEDFEETEELKAIGDIGSSAEVATDIEVNYGSRLLLPHVPVVLQYLSSVVREMTSQKPKKSAPTRDLNILSHISQYVKDAQQSGVIINLFLPYLARLVVKDEDAEVHIINSLANLIKQVDQPVDFVIPVSKLFSVIINRLSRTALCSIVLSIADKAPWLKEAAEIVDKLNSWDPRRVEEPDYNTRLDAFETINKIVREMKKLREHFIILVMHNCSYFMANLDDISIRASSSFCMTEIIKKLSSMSIESSKRQNFLNNVLLPEIRSGLRIKKEAPRHEFIKILACAVRSFPKHEVFAELSQLCDAEDIEKDYFENIQHIQMHRRSRAMKRVMYLLAEKSISHKILLAYLMPMASAYLQDRTYAATSHLIDAAIEMVAAICKRLPWKQYNQILRHFLAQLPKSLENQKMIVRVLVAILDSFHFDLSAAPELGLSGTNVAPPKQLDGRDNVEDEDDVEDEEKNEDSHSAVETKCTPDEALRIHSAIIGSILPQLRGILTQKVKGDDIHKMAGSKYAEDAEILRVPIAIAMVKLLQQLPKSTFRTYLPSVLLKVCEFLRSRTIEIRDTARDTLMKILKSLGPAYFVTILSELRTALTRGYQLHVLGYTVHALMKSIESDLTCGILDKTLASLVQVFQEELYGEVSNEKDVRGITEKCPEARSVRSFDAYEMVATYVGKGMITKLLTPQKEILDTTHNRKTVQRVHEVLQRIGNGLLENKDLPVDSLCMLAHGLIMESLPLMTSVAKAKQAEPAPVDPTKRPPSSLLITHAAPRGGIKPKHNTKTNMHIVVEFGLQVLYMLLKRGRLIASQGNNMELLDPFVPILTDCLESKHIKITTVALRCLAWIIKQPLPSVKDCITRITNAIFVLLKNYAVPGAAKGDNFEMVLMCFKAVTVLVRDVQHHTISDEQLQVLLNYVEADMYDFTRQSTAFTLFKAILSRKLTLPELYEVIEKIEKMSITDESPLVRLQCRQVILQFLLDYPFTINQMKKHLDFYVTQLNYERETGRESVLEMLASIFMSFPKKLLHSYSGYFFIPMAAQLVNDDSAKCRKLTALAMKSLMEKIEAFKRDELFAIIKLWWHDEKVVHRRLAVQSVGLMVEVESATFERRLPDVIPIIQQQIEPGRYSETDTESEAKVMDHVLFNHLTTLAKILKECYVIGNANHAADMAVIWDYVRSHLRYSHTWVRLAAAQLFGILFASLKIEDFNKSDVSSNEYMFVDSKLKIRELTREFLHQFKGFFDDELGEQVIKNLVFLAKVTTSVNPDDPVPENKDDDEEVDKTKRVPSLRWLIKMMCKEATFEGAQNQLTTVKRTLAFKFLGAIATQLDKEKLSYYLKFMLPPVCRAATDNSSISDEALKLLAQEVLEVMKGIVGVEAFTKMYATVYKTMGEKREERKRKRAMDAISMPEVAARRKMKKHLQKQNSKKRKIVETRTTKTFKKKKLSDKKSEY